jgi:hypothetical protein
MPTVNTSIVPGLSTLRDLLEIISTLRGASDPFGSLDGLRGAIALITRLGTTLQVNPIWLAWLQRIADDEPLLDVLLAVGQYVEHLIETPAVNQNSQVAGEKSSIQAVDFSQWLSLLAEILQLVRQLRGQPAQA